MKTIIKFSTFAILALFVTSCCNCGKGSPKIGDLEKGKWELIELNGTEIADSKMFLTFDGEKKMVYGTVPCNNFFGGYTLFENGDQNIKIGNAGRTMRFCPDSQIEDKFAAQMSTITKVKIDGGKLLMTNEKGELIAVLKHIAK